MSYTNIEFIVRVFDGDLSETKQEAMQRHQQKINKIHQAAQSHIKNRIGMFLTRKISLGSKPESPARKD